MNLHRLVPRVKNSRRLDRRIHGQHLTFDGPAVPASNPSMTQLPLRRLHQTLLHRSFRPMRHSHSRPSHTSGIQRSRPNDLSKVLKPRMISTFRFLHRISRSTRNDYTYPRQLLVVANRNNANLLSRIARGRPPPDTLPKQSTSVPTRVHPKASRNHRMLSIPRRRLEISQ